MIRVRAVWAASGGAALCRRDRELHGRSRRKTHNTEAQIKAEMLS